MSFLKVGAWGYAYLSFIKDLDISTTVISTDPKLSNKEELKTRRAFGIGN